jgi:hypothetical protein
MKIGLACVALALVACAPKEYLVRGDDLARAQSLPAPEATAIPATRHGEAAPLAVLIRGDRLEAVEARADGMVRVRARRPSKMLWPGVAVLVAGAIMTIGFSVWLAQIHADRKPCGDPSSLGCGLGQFFDTEIDAAVGTGIATGLIATLTGGALMYASTNRHPQEVQPRRHDVFYLNAPPLVSLSF